MGTRRGGYTSGSYKLQLIATIGVGFKAPVITTHEPSSRQLQGLFRVEGLGLRVASCFVLSGEPAPKIGMTS